MKKYVIITAGIGGMGGGQMYARNKYLYLHNLGWKVEVLSPAYNNIIIPELKGFENGYQMPEYPSYYYSKRKRQRVTKELVNYVNDDNYDTLIIESNTISGATWAEIIADQSKGKHIAFPLGENFNITNKGMQSFLVFKHKRIELAGIMNRSLLKMFESFYPIAPEDSYCLEAYSNNVEADIDSPYLHSIDNTRYDFIVGVLSRLDKDYVQPAIENFVNFAIQCKDKRFLLLLIGDKSEDSSRSLTYKEMISSKSSNIEVVITGNLYPLPIKLLEMCDVFFSCSGSSWVCMRSGVPTITFDANDLKPIGILGRTTNSSLYRQIEEPAQDLNFLLDEILIKRVYKKTGPSYDIEAPDFQTHMDFIEKSSPKKVYYDIESITISPREWVSWKLNKMLGDTLFHKIYTLKVNALKILK